MLMFDFIDYSSNHSDTTVSSCFYSKDEATSFNNNIANTDVFKLSLYEIILRQRTFFSTIKLAFQEKFEFYLFYYNAFFKDRILFQ